MTKKQAHLKSEKILTQVWGGSSLERALKQMEITAKIWGIKNTKSNDK